MADKEFIDGLLVKAPHERAPDFVKASISIKVKELAAWLTNQSDEWINVDVKEARSGKWYAEVSTFKPKEGSKPAPSTPAKKSGSSVADLEDDLAF